MDRQLHILEALYGEAEDRREVHRVLREDEELWREYRALAEIKGALDQRPPSRPDAATLEAVFAAAGETIPPAQPRRDRAPVARRAGRLRTAGGLAVLLVVVAAGLGLWRAGEEASTPLPAVSSTPAPEVAEQARTPAEIGREPAAATPLSRPSTEDEAAPALAWDSDAEVIDLHRRIERLEAAVGLNWDEPAVPLEAAPIPGRRDAYGAGGIHQVGGHPDRDR